MNPNRNLITLDEFTIHQTRHFPKATGDLSALLRDIGLASKIINEKVNKAGLTDVLGQYGNTNVQGEEQMKLDVFADDILKRVLKNSAECAGIASEENDDFIAFTDDYSINSKYVVLFDPLDGSSNIDVNASIGTIFAIYKRLTPLGNPVVAEDFLQKGEHLMAAGYVIYGSSTMLVYATKLGVNGFTLDPTIGEFCLSHRNMKINPEGNIYSVNQGNYQKFSTHIKSYIDYCLEIDKETKRPYKHRYIGSMVADLHRTLIKGGVFIYPDDINSPNGKLRLMYECNPMAFLVENANGKAINSKKERILEIQPENLHERIPIFIGSSNMIDKIESFL